ncbi:hypothetical protein BKA93DRAFT_557347 [Sparassis latifolia]
MLENEPCRCQCVIKCSRHDAILSILLTFTDCALNFGRCRLVCLTLRASPLPSGLSYINWCQRPTQVKLTGRFHFLHFFALRPNTTSLCLIYSVGFPSDFAEVMGKLSHRLSIAASSSFRLEAHSRRGNAEFVNGPIFRYPDRADLQAVGASGIFQVLPQDIWVYTV